MSDLDAVPGGQLDNEAAGAGFSNSGMPAPEPTAGTLLRQAREAAGMHIAALAVSLKVPVKKLEALEQDRFDLLPDAVFVRALASSVCRTLKLDAAPVLGLLPQTTAPKLTYQGSGINAPFRTPGEGPSPSVWTQVSKQAVLAGVLLLLGALVLIFMPKQDGSGKNGADTMPAAMGESVKPLPAAVAMGGSALADDAKAPASAAQVHEPFAAASSAASGAQPPATAAAMAAVPLSMAVLSPAAGTPTPAPTAVAAPAATPAAPAAPAPILAASQPAQAAPAGIVTFRAKGDSWVEVIDAKGTVVLRRLLTAGEVAGASGALPLAAVVGKADVTQVQVRGQAFDLNAVARDNVARFEVK